MTEIIKVGALGPEDVAISRPMVKREQPQQVDLTIWVYINVCIQLLFLITMLALHCEWCLWGKLVNSTGNIFWLSAIRCFTLLCFLVLQVKRRYRIAPVPTHPDRRRNSSLLLSDARQRISMKLDRDVPNVITKSQIDLELAKIRSMTAQEAAAVAAQAVAEAEAAIAEAEEAAKEAEAAEADAEAAQAFADAAMKTLNGGNSPKLVSPLFYINHYQ